MIPFDLSYTTLPRKIAGEMKNTDTRYSNKNTFIDILMMTGNMSKTRNPCYKANSHKHFVILGVTLGAKMK